MPSMFLPLHFTTSHCIVQDPAHPPIFEPRLGFGSLSSPTMAQPGSSHSFTPMEDLPSATSSIAAFKPEDRHLTHFLLKTRELTGLSSKQLPIPLLGEVGDLTLAESTILPLFCSMTHAMASVLKPVEELRLKRNDLEAQVANSLLVVTDHSNQLNEIHSSLRDLSHSVTHFPRHS